jgi:hypothetical protein
MSIFIACWDGFYHTFTDGDESKECTWSAQDLRDALAEVSDVTPDALPLDVLMCPRCTVQDLFDDPSEDFLTNAEEILYLLGAPEWCHMYAEDEVLLLHDYGSQGSHVMYLRGTPRLDAWSESQVMDFLSAMHICDRWTPSRSDVAALLWHMETMDFEQRKICTSVIDAAVDGMLSLCYESYVNPGVQDTVRRCLSDIETIGMLDRKCTLRVFNLHTMTACLEECAQVILRSIDSQDKYGVGRWEIVYGFRAYMRDHPCRSTLFKIVWGRRCQPPR